MTIKFPDWAPDCLIDDYEMMNSDKSNHESLMEILKKLLTDSRMEKVWKAIEKRTEENSILIEFFAGVQEAYHGPDNWMKKTIAEQEAWKKKVIEQVSDLKTSLKEHDFFYSGYYLLSVDVKIDILKNLKLDGKLEKRVIEPIDKKYDYKRLGIQFLIDGDRDTATDEYELKPNAIETDDLLMGVLCGRLGRFTSTETMLDTLSSHINNIDTDWSYLKQPNADDAHIVYFMRFLANHNMEYFGQPLYEVVSNTTSVMYDTDISKERARDTIKYVLAAWDKVNRS